MPQLQEYFGAGVSAVQLTLSLFLLGFAAGQLVCGPFSDRFGRRPVLLVGLGVFTAAGLACAASTSIPLLVGARFVQGMGASVGPILARAVVRDLFVGRRASAALSQITQVMILAPLLAPTLGGYMLVFFGWPAIFLVLTGFGVLLAYMCWRYLPETLPAPAAEGGRLSHLREGLRAVVTHRSSLRYALTICFSYGGLFAYISGSPFVFIDGFGVDEQHFGYYFALTATALLAGATVNRALLSRHAPATLIRWSVRLLAAAGVTLFALVWFGLGGLAGVIAPMMAYLFSLGLVQPNATAAAMAPHGRLAGVSSSVIGSLQTAGGALAGYVVGAMYDHTAFSLAATVAALSVLTLAVAGGRGAGADLDPSLKVAPRQPLPTEA
jgi:DHA1 family bicyclomycin/chloramphenicol resistance-like MFS transporter